MESDHEIWSYVYFLIHLYCKDKSDMNGVESTVLEKSEKKEMSWFPLLKCLQMSDKKNVGQDSNTTELEDLEQELHHKFQRTEEAIQKLETLLS